MFLTNKEPVLAKAKKKKKVTNKRPTVSTPILKSVLKYLQIITLVALSMCILTENEQNNR